ncbi:MAG: hypothetical protein ABR500_11820 [Dermatophilaceae bacterium]|nr:hypothetical protein [Intrasporangiaceae bacterium]
MKTVLLGPQRFRMTAGAVADEVAPEGPVVTVTAGWRDREKDDAELDDVFGGRSRNLHLFTRLGRVIRHDRGFAAAASAYNRAVDEASSLYVLRLRDALETVYATMRRTAREDLVDSSLRAGLQSVRDIDAWYLWVLAELEGELRAEGGVDTSEVIAQHRHEVGEAMSGAALLAIAGGHVSMLMRCLRLFSVEPAAELPVIGWSAGAMVLTDLIVLYHDKGPEGVRASEVWDRGLGRARGVVAMPHARRRIHLDDPVRNRVIAHRFAPARVLLLDDGSRVPVGEDGGLPDEALVVTRDGAISTIGEERADEAAAHAQKDGAS